MTDIRPRTRTQVQAGIDRSIAYADPSFIDGTQACAGSDPEIFFPEIEAYAAALPAVRLCRRCPLVTKCGTWAINTRQERGVWGAMTPRQRRAVVAKNGGKW